MSDRYRRADGRLSRIRRLGSGPVVVVLAGGPGADPEYLEDLGGLGASVELVVPDPRGTGGSPPPDDPSGYAFDRQADDVEALRQHLGRDRLVLVAHSAGCTAALAWAGRHPTHLAGLVLVAPSRFLDEAIADDTSTILAARSHEAWYTAASDALRRLGEGPDPREVPGLIEALAPTGYARWTDRERLHARLMRPSDPVVTSAFWRATTDPRDILRGLEEVSVPVLVVTGALDAATGVVAGEAWARRLGGTHVTLDGVAHVPWVDDPHAFVGVVGPFLSSVTGSVQ